MWICSISTARPTFISKFFMDSTFLLQTATYVLQLKDRYGLNWERCRNHSPQLSNVIFTFTKDCLYIVLFFASSPHFVHQLYSHYNHSRLGGDPQRWLGRPKWRWLQGNSVNTSSRVRVSNEGSSYSLFWLLIMKIALIDLVDPWSHQWVHLVGLTVSFDTGCNNSRFTRPLGHKHSGFSDYSNPRAL